MQRYHVWCVQALKSLFLLVIVLPVLGCNLSNSPQVTVTTATPAPAALTVPLVAVNPVYGPPGTSVTLTTAGFVPGTQFNVFISSPTVASSTPTTVVTANAGITTFTVPLPQQINGTAVANGTPLLFTLTPTNGGPNATALFWVQGPSAVGSTATPGSQVTPGGQLVPTTQSSGATTGVFITAPPINSTVAGSSVAVTGSAPAGPVTVQVQDANNAVLGSASASSQVSSGTLGVWQATVSFTPPAAGTTGFIVAIQGGQQASIPITFTGGATTGGATGATAIVPVTVVVPATLVFSTPSPGAQIGSTPSGGS